MSAPDLRDPVGRVRVMGMVEACSFLVLLGFSVLKRLPSVTPEWNEIGKKGVLMVGMTHGVLLMIFLLTLFLAWGDKALSGKQCRMAFIASLLPFGPFFIDRKLAVAESTAVRAEDATD
jgi:integral membrane protein